MIRLLFCYQLISIRLRILNQILILINFRLRDKKYCSWICWQNGLPYIGGRSIVLRMRARIIAHHRTPVAEQIVDPVAFKRQLQKTLFQHYVQDRLARSRHIARGIECIAR